MRPYENCIIIEEVLLLTEAVIKNQTIYYLNQGAAVNNGVACNNNGSFKGQKNANEMVEALKNRKI